MARRSALALLPMLLFAAVAAAQSPTRFLACESRDNTCAQPAATLDQTWIFDGTEGTATSATGNEQPSHLSIQKFDSTALVVQRTDASGLTAVYTGTVQGAHVTGTVQWSWPGHAGYPASGIFSAVLQDTVAAAPVPAASVAPVSPLPPQLLVCENQGPPCSAAWTFQGTEGTAVWFDENHTHAHLTIVRAEPDYIVVRRTDTTSPNSAIYTGSLRGDHYAGTVVYSSPGHPGDRTGSWNASVPKFTCDPHDDLSHQEAMALGQTGLMFHHSREAIACYTLAAGDGDVTAQRIVGRLYYVGSNDVPQDYAKALYWLQKAADQGIYQAERTVSEMYEAGQGTRPNPALARMYKDRADEQKHDFERQQDLNEREADRRTQVLSSFVLGASIGMFW